MPPFLTVVASLVLLGPLAPEPHARDVRFLDAKTFVVLETSRRIDVSTDAGATWSARELPWDPVDGSMDVAMDERGMLWAFLSDRWHRDRRRSELASSRDLGATWTTIRWPTSTSFPHAFLTHEREPVVMLDDTGQCWLHAAAEKETLRAWTKLGAPVPDATRAAGVTGFRDELGLFVSSWGVRWSSDRGATWTNLGGPRRMLAIAPLRGSDERAGVVGLDLQGVVHVLDLASAGWRTLGALPRADAHEDAHPTGIAVAKEGVWVVGWNRSGPLAGRIDLDGRWRSPAGTPRAAYSPRIRVAPDGRAWLVDDAIYACGPAADAWERVWPR